MCIDDFIICNNAELEETQSDETSLPAHVMWKEARVGRDQVVNPDLQHIYDECVSIPLCL